MGSILQDENTLWHDKPTQNGQPSSNNWMIYSAYAKVLGLPIDENKMREYFQKCVVRLDRDNITVNRHPNKTEPPLSFDECIGAVFLGLMPYDALKGNHFVYIGHGERLDERFFGKLVKALAEFLMPKVIVKGWSVTVKKPNLDDRNRWWKKNLENVRYFAARLSPDKTYAIKKFCGRSYHQEEIKLYSFVKECVRKNKDRSHQDRSTRNLQWLLCMMAKDYKTAADLKPWKSFEAYFGASHPFVPAIKRMYGV